MTLIIGATPYSHWQTLIPMLEQLGWNGQQSADVETWLQSSFDPPAGDRFILLHSRPELALACAVEAGVSLDLAYKAWNLAVDNMLSFYQRNRQRAVLVDSVAAAGNHEVLMNWLSSNHVAFSSEKSVEECSALPMDSIALPPSTLLMVASHFVAGAPELEAKLARLEAMSVPLNDRGYVAPELRVADVLQELESARNAKDSLKAHVEEAEQRIKQMEKDERLKSSEHKKQVELLELLLHQTQEELNDLVKERDTPLIGSDTEQNLEEVRTELIRVKEKLKITENTLGKDLNNAKAENELLLLQLHQVQEEMEDQHLEIGRLKSEVKQVELELDKAHNQVESARTEKAALQERLEEQLRLTKEHLSRTQSDLQTYHGRAKQFEAEASRKQAAIEKLNKTVSEKNQKLQKLSRAKKRVSEQAALLQRELKAAEHQQQILSDELTRIQRSISWRLASPVRAITDVARLAHKPSRQKKVVSQQACLIEDSDLFDPGWYLDRYPDVASAGMPPAEHYLAYGATEGRDPSEHFSTNWYLRKYQDVAQSGMNPLLHYLLHGQAEGRKPAPGVKA